MFVGMTVSLNFSNGNICLRNLGLQLCLGLWRRSRGNYAAYTQQLGSLLIAASPCCGRCYLAVLEKLTPLCDGDGLRVTSTARQQRATTGTGSSWQVYLLASIPWHPCGGDTWYRLCHPLRWQRRHHHNTGERNATRYVNWMLLHNTYTPASTHPLAPIPICTSRSFQNNPHHGSFSCCCPILSYPTTYLGLLPTACMWLQKRAVAPARAARSSRVSVVARAASNKSSTATGLTVLAR